MAISDRHFNDIVQDKLLDNHKEKRNHDRLTKFCEIHKLNLLIILYHKIITCFGPDQALTDLVAGSKSTSEEVL